MKKIFLLIFPILLLPSMVRALTISPPVIELKLKPGESQEFFLKVFNETEEDLYLSLALSSFKASDQEGRPLIDEEKIFQDYFSWFAFSENSLILKPLEVKSVRAVVNVPEKATPGGYYLAVLWQTSAAAGGARTSLGISSEVGYLILLRVDGEIKEQGNLSNFSLKKSRSLFNPLPVVFSLNFNNLGNVHLKPQGKIEIRNKFGFLVKVLEVNPTGGNVLPGSSRQFNIFWFNPWQLLREGKISLFQALPIITEPFAFGKYTAKLKLEFGSDGQEIVQDLSFYLFSGYFILLLLLILFLITLLIILNRRWKKNYKRKRE